MSAKEYEADSSAWPERLRHRFDDRRVHVFGLGLFGGQTELIRFLHGLGARLTVSDRKPAIALKRSLDALADLADIDYQLGQELPPDGAADFDFIAPSPAVPPRSAQLKAAAALGIPIVTEIDLFLECCPAAITAVTGSAGKSTIVSLIGLMHERAGHRVWVGGNLGRSLLCELGAIGATDVVVLELSSFQLQRMNPGFRPFRVAVLASIFEHHLDWHGAFEHYVKAKERIFEGQEPGRDLAIYDAPPVSAGATRLRGLIMRRNCGLAAAAARARGVGETAIAQAMAEFGGLPHRFEEVARMTLPGGGAITFINASKATCPRTAASALAVADQPIFAILGGAPFAAGAEEELDPLAWACQRTAGRAGIGPAASLLQRTLGELAIYPSLQEATQAMAAAAQARGGGTVLLVPGFPSYDAYSNYEERGDDFRTAAQRFVAAADGDPDNRNVEIV